jgi:hypothetical protein
VRRGGVDDGRHDRQEPGLLRRVVLRDGTHVCDGTPVSPDPNELARRLERLGERLRTLGATRQAAVAPTVMPLVEALAVAAADAEGVPRTPLGDAGPHALGDQVLVLGRDLVAALRDRPDADRTVAASRLVEELARVVP